MAESSSDNGNDKLRRKTDHDMLEIRAFGVALRTSGKNVIAFVSFLLLFGAIGYVLWDHDRDSKDNAKAVLHVQTEILKEMQTLRGEMVAERRVTNYILTLSPESKAQLKLEEPDELRARRR